MQKLWIGGDFHLIKLTYGEDPSQSCTIIGADGCVMIFKSEFVFDKCVNTINNLW